MKPWGALRGRVVDEDGKPAAKVRVEKEPNPPGSLEGDTVTDANGEFRFTTIKPGTVPAPDRRQQAPHIVVSVFMRGLLRRLVTRSVMVPTRSSDAADSGKVE